MPELERRLKERGGVTPENIEKRLKVAEEEIEQSKVVGFHDKVFVNDNLGETFKEIESYIFGFDEVRIEAGDEAEAKAAAEEGGDKATDVVVQSADVEMADGEEARDKSSSLSEPAATPIPETVLEDGTGAVETLVPAEVEMEEPTEE